MKYNLVEIFASVQGEGINAGRPAIFVRFAGCNKQCPFCDTNHETKLSFTVEDIVAHIDTLCTGEELVVFTGGEPLLQEAALSRVMRARPFFQYELETNGSINPRYLYDFISLSPKQAPDETLVKTCSSFKLLYPYQGRWTLKDWAFTIATVRYLQLVSPWTPEIFQQAITEVKKSRMSWRIGIQQHKIWGIR